MTRAANIERGKDGPGPWGRRLRRFLTRRVLPRLPGLAALVLRLRARRRPDRINRVLATPAAVARHYRPGRGGPASRSVMTTGAPAVAGAPGVATLLGARVLGQPPAVVGPDGALLWPYSPQLKRLPAGCDAVWRPCAAPRLLAGRTYFAAVDGFSYYHWLTGTLPKLLLARAAGFEPYDHVLVNPRHKGRVTFQTESLAWLGVPPAKVVWLERGTHVRCEALSLPPAPAGPAQTELAAWAIELLRGAFLPSGSAPGSARIYITRAGARRRRLANEDAVLACLVPLGFAAVALEALPLAAQIERLHGASVVVGLHGAGLGNLLFCRPGTQVVEILPDAWPNPCFRNLADTCGLRYQSVPAAAVGARAGFQADAAVDVARLRDAVHTACRGGLSKPGYR